MDTVVMELEENPEGDSMNLSESKSKQPNVGMVKQEVPEADDILLQHEVRTSKPENVCTDEQLESASFTIGNKLHKNMKHASGVKPFKCNICGHSYSSKGNFKAHIITHTGEKPFKCTICDYSSVQKSNLKTHLITHTGEKPFNCNICDYSCGQQGNLNAHLRTHTGEKPFKCNICECSCARRSSLIRHLRPSHMSQKS